MSHWRAVHAYGSAIDAMLLDVVGPFLESNADTVEHGHWVRHFAGGPHIRVRLRAAPDRVAAASADLRRRFQDWFAAHGAPPLERYSADRAAELLRMEAIDPATEDLTYRNGVAIERPYVPDHLALGISSAMGRLIEDFRSVRGTLALEVLRRPKARHEEVLKLYLAIALFLGRGSYAPGSVSFKSHWENFAVTVRSDALIDRILSSYERSRRRLLPLVEAVSGEWSSRHRSTDGLLSRWWSLLEANRSQALRILDEDRMFVDDPNSREQAAALRERVFSHHARPRSAFVETHWGNEEFLALVQFDVPSLLPRTLVNLLYDLLAAIGVNPVDKMAFCHHAFRLVEETTSTNLDELLQRNIVEVLRRHGDRLGGRGVSIAPSADQESGG